jgi:molybdopterin converting factor small subunit
MKVYLRTAGRLRALLRPDEDSYTRCLEVGDGATLKEILDEVDIPHSAVAFAFSNGKLERLDYRPVDGDVITLQPPVSGG